MTDSTPMFDRHHEGLIHNMSFTIMRDTRNNQWVTEAWCLVDGGLRHQVMRWHTRPRVTEIRTECSGTGFFSKRPYTLGQACDGSISAPVIALYADFCKARGLDAVALLQRAYPDEDAWDIETFTRTRADADWQGTNFPAVWNAKAVQGLLASLTEINYHQLIGIVEDCANNNRAHAHARTA